MFYSILVHQGHRKGWLHAGDFSSQCSCTQVLIGDIFRFSVEYLILPSRVYMIALWKKTFTGGIKGEDWLCMTRTIKSWMEPMFASYWCYWREAVGQKHRIDLREKKNCEKCQTWKDAIDPEWNHSDWSPARDGGQRWFTTEWLLIRSGPKTKKEERTDSTYLN